MVLFFFYFPIKVDGGHSRSSRAKTPAPALTDNPVLLTIYLHIDFLSLNKMLKKEFLRTKHVILFISSFLKFYFIFQKKNKIDSQCLQIFVISRVTVTSASQILESFWNIWSQVSQ